MLSAVSRFCHRYFVLIVLAAAGLGYVVPAWLLWVGDPVVFPRPTADFGLVLHELPVDGIIVGLGLIMFGMGMTLDLSDFRRALTHPFRIGVGVLLQFLIMPVVAFALVMAFQLSNVTALGVILVGCCPGGTASNVIAFLADADVPLSVAVTLASTLLAPLATPWLVWLYGQKLLGFYRGDFIDVPVGLLMKVILVIVVPLLVGVFVKRFGQSEETPPLVEDVFTLLSIAVISLIVGYVVATASNNNQLLVSLYLILPVVAHNLVGLVLGYGGGWFFQFPLESVRSLSIEVGMQNSGLAVALAGVLQANMTGRFGSAELATMAIPAVLFSVWHNISGPVLAACWSRSR